MTVAHTHDNVHGRREGASDKQKGIADINASKLVEDIVSKYKSQAYRSNQHKDSIITSKRVAYMYEIKLRVIVKT